MPIRGLVLATILISACQNNVHQPPSNTSSSFAESADCRTIQHEMGKTEICGQPESVVVLGPYLLEQVLALGVQPAGYGDHVALHQGDYDNPSQQIPYLGDRVTTQPINVGLAYQPSIEAILKAQPDLIIAPASVEAGQYEQLAAIAPTVSFEISGGKSNLSAIGQALGLRDRADALATETAARIEQAQAEFAPLVETHPQVLMLVAGDMQTLNLVSHTNSRCGALVQELGFQPIYPEGVTGDDPTAVAAVSLEALPELDAADSILLFAYDWDASGGDETTGFDQQQSSALIQAWEKNAIAQSMQASQAERVYVIPAYLCLGLPGPIGTELYLEKLQEKLLSPG